MLLCFFHARVLNREPKNFFHADIVEVFLEDKIAKPKMFFNVPASETTCEFHYILLGITTIHAQGVKLQQFTCIILIGMALLVGLIIKIYQHGWRMSRCPQQITK